jgi:hypothetical protein
MDLCGALPVGGTGGTLALGGNTSAEHGDGKPGELR